MNEKIHPFLEGILHYCQGKEVEVYCGDVKTMLKFNEKDISYKNILRGIVKEGWGDCLVLTVTENNHEADIYINSWSIKSVLPLNNHFSMKNMYMDEHEGGL